MARTKSKSKAPAEAAAPASTTAAPAPRRGTRVKKALPPVLDEARKEERRDEGRCPNCGVEGSLVTRVSCTNCGHTKPA